MITCFLLVDRFAEKDSAVKNLWFAQPQFSLRGANWFQEDQFVSVPSFRTIAMTESTLILLIHKSIVVHISPIRQFLECSVPPCFPDNKT